MKLCRDILYKCLKNINLLENITKFCKKNNIMIDYDNYKHGNQKIHIWYQLCNFDANINK